MKQKMNDQTKPDSCREAFNLIKAQAEAFFEWPTADKSHVTTTSALLFAESILEKERAAIASITTEQSATAVAYMVVSPRCEYRYLIRPDQHDDHIRRGFKLHPIFASGRVEVVPRAEYTAALRLLTDRIAELEAHSIMLGQISMLVDGYCDTPETTTLQCVERMVDDLTLSAIVPREERPSLPMTATPAMLDRAVSFALNVSLSSEYTWSHYMADLWVQMIAAAPDCCKAIAEEKR